MQILIFWLVLIGIISLIVLIRIYSNRADKVNDRIMAEKALKEYEECASENNCTTCHHHRQCRDAIQLWKEIKGGNGEEPMLLT
jgi:hypothetical protein